MARERGWPYAEVLDLGVGWDGGAPLPHVVASSGKTVVVCHAASTPLDWDGSWAQSVSPSDTREEPFLLITFERCYALRFGPPNDEALHGHPLMGRGLEYYRAHEVTNSDWLAEAIRINSVHPQHDETRYRALHHYFLAFHDEVFEALSPGLSVRQVTGTLESLLIAETRGLIHNG